MTLIAIVMTMLVLTSNCYATECDQKIYFLFSKKNERAKSYRPILNKIKQKESNLLFSEIGTNNHNKIKSVDKSNSIFIASTPKTYKWLNRYIPRKNAFFVSLSRAFVVNNETLLTKDGQRPLSMRGLYIDPDPRLQIALTRILLGESTQIALLYTDKTSYLTDFLMTGESKTKLINSSHFDLRRSFRKLEDFDVLVAIPDHNIYNRYSIPDVISYLYRKGKPLVGYSKSMVSSGALATLYNDASIIAEDIITSINEICSGSFGEQAKYGSSYRVMINHEIAKTLNIAVEHNASELSLLIKNISTRK